MLDIEEVRKSTKEAREIFINEFERDHSETIYNMEKEIEVATKKGLNETTLSFYTYDIDENEVLRYLLFKGFKSQMSHWTSGGIKHKTMEVYW